MGHLHPSRSMLHVALSGTKKVAGIASHGNPGQETVAARDEHSSTGETEAHPPMSGQALSPSVPVPSPPTTPTSPAAIRVSAKVRANAVIKRATRLESEVGEQPVMHNHWAKSFCREVLDRIDVAICRNDLAELRHISRVALLLGEPRPGSITDEEHAAKVRLGLIRLITDVAEATRSTASRSVRQPDTANDTKLWWSIAGLGLAGHLAVTALRSNCVVTLLNQIGFEQTPPSHPHATGLHPKEGAFWDVGLLARSARDVVGYSLKQHYRDQIGTLEHALAVLDPGGKDLLLLTSAVEFCTRTKTKGMSETELAQIVLRLARLLKYPHSPEVRRAAQQAIKSIGQRPEYRSIPTATRDIVETAARRQLARLAGGILAIGSGAVPHHVVATFIAQQGTPSHNERLASIISYIETLVAIGASSPETITLVEQIAKSRQCSERSFLADSLRSLATNHLGRANQAQTASSNAVVRAPAKRRFDQLPAGGASRRMVLNTLLSKTTEQIVRTATGEA